MTFQEMLAKANPEDREKILALASTKAPYMRTKWRLEDYCPDGNGIHELCTGYPILDDFPEG